MVAGGVSAALWPDAEKFASVHHQGLMAHGLQPAAAVLCCTWLTQWDQAFLQSFQEY